MRSENTLAKEAGALLALSRIRESRSPQTRGAVLTCLRSGVSFSPLSLADTRVSWTLATSDHWPERFFSPFDGEAQGVAFGKSTHLELNG